VRAQPGRSCARATLLRLPAAWANLTASPFPFLSNEPLLARSSRIPNQNSWKDRSISPFLDASLRVLRTFRNKMKPCRVLAALIRPASHKIFHTLNVVILRRRCGSFNPELHCCYEVGIDQTSRHHNTGDRDGSFDHSDDTCLPSYLRPLTRFHDATKRDVKARLWITKLTHYTHTG
jgi:hypothetical protein